MCAIEDYDDPSIYCEEVRKAKKEHICSECRRAILKKENYRNVFGVWENKPTTFKTCSHCMIPQDWLRKECNGFLHGNLEDEILEHAEEYKKIFLYRWVVGIRRQWK
jgi:hypothetical protein